MSNVITPKVVVCRVLTGFILNVHLLNENQEHRLFSSILSHLKLVVYFCYRPTKVIRYIAYARYFLVYSVRLFHHRTEPILLEKLIEIICAENSIFY